MKQVLLDFTRQACQDLFEDYGVSLEPQDEATLQHVSYCGVVGFAGDTIRGSIVLAGGAPTLNRTNPLGPSAGLRDWVGELTNQLVGRFKSQLLRREVIVYITTPIVLRGQQLVLEPRIGVTQSVGFSSPDGAVRVWLDAELDPGFVLGEELVEPECLSEGESILF